MIILITVLLTDNFDNKKIFEWQINYFYQEMTYTECSIYIQIRFKPIINTNYLHNDNNTLLYTVTTNTITTRQVSRQSVKLQNVQTLLRSSVHKHTRHTLILHITNIHSHHPSTSHKSTKSIKSSRSTKSSLSHVLSRVAVTWLIFQLDSPLSFSESSRKRGRTSRKCMDTESVPSTGTSLSLSLSLSLKTRHREKLHRRGIVEVSWRPVARPSRSTSFVLFRARPRWLRFMSPGTMRTPPAFVSRCSIHSRRCVAPVPPARIRAHGRPRSDFIAFHRSFILMPGLVFPRNRWNGTLSSLCRRAPLDSPTFSFTLLARMFILRAVPRVFRNRRFAACYARKSNGLFCTWDICNGLKRIGGKRVFKRFRYFPFFLLLLYGFFFYFLGEGFM